MDVPRVQEAARGELGGVWAGAPVLAPQLPHLLPPVLHQRLVFRHAQLLAVHDAGPLGPWPVSGHSQQLILRIERLLFCLKENEGLQNSPHL